jgi:hypothetical protein
MNGRTVERSNGRAVERSNGRAVDRILQWQLVNRSGEVKRWNGTALRRQSGTSVRRQHDTSVGRESLQSRGLGFATGKERGMTPALGRVRRDRERESRFGG